MKVFFKKILFIIPKFFHKKFLILFFLLIINSLLEIFSIGMLLPIFEMVKDEKSYLIQYLESIKFFDFFNLFSKDSANIYLVLIFIFLISFLFKTFFHILTIKYSVNLIANLKTKLSYEIFLNYTFKNFLYFKKKSSSSIIRNLIKEISEFCDRFLLSSTNLLLDSLIIFVIITFLFIYIPYEVIYLIIYSLLFFLIFFFFK